MRTYLPRRFAWGLCLLTVTLVVLALALQPSRAPGVTLAEQLSSALYVVNAVPLSVCGALITSRRPGNRIGPLVLAGAFVLSVLFAASYLGAGLDRQGVFPGHTWARWLATWVGC